MKKLFYIIFLLGLAWSFLFAGFVIDLRNQTPSSEAADGLVVLTGGQGRIDGGFKLLSEGQGKRLLLSGINQDLDFETIMRDIGQDQDLKDCCVDAESNSTDTRSNAIEAISWAKKNGYKSLILITSDFHMPRSQIIFDEYSTGILIIPHPVKSEISPLGMALEFNKYLLSLARAGLTT
ncbi:MAG: YdcF family protein [Sphingomonadales bacterium]